MKTHSPAPLIRRRKKPVSSPYVVNSRLKSVIRTDRRSALPEPPKPSRKARFERWQESETVTRKKRKSPRQVVTTHQSPSTSSKAKPASSSTAKSSSSRLARCRCMAMYALSLALLWVPDFFHLRNSCMSTMTEAKTSPIGFACCARVSPFLKGDARERNCRVVMQFW